MAQRVISGIILAAGKGTRMKSDLPKCLHRICGLTMAEIVARELKAAGVERPCIVIGHGADQMKVALGEGYDYALQAEQLGTGHAARIGAEALGEIDGCVIVCFGDTPLLTRDVFQTLIDHQQSTEAESVFAVAHLANPFGYGRILRDAAGRPSRVVEEKDATDEIRQIREVNVGIYCFDAAFLRKVLPRIKNENAQGEFYLTDTVAESWAAGGRAEAVPITDPSLLLGVNDRAQLAEAEQLLRRRINRHHMLNGVTLQDPEQTYIGLDVDIAPDAQIFAGTHLEGATKIGPRAKIGPNARVTDSEVKSDACVQYAVVQFSEVGERAKVGPYAFLRANAVVADDAKVGTYVEIKNSEIGVKASVAHLSYIGDATVGPRANIGAGVITANYDGFLKHETNIGRDAFVGSNSTLVAPVTIGHDAFVGAGSVINKDVPPNALGIVRAERKTIEQWTDEYRRRKLEERDRRQKGQAK